MSGDAARLAASRRGRVALLEPKRHALHYVQIGRILDNSWQKKAGETNRVVKLGHPLRLRGAHHAGVKILT